MEAVWDACKQVGRIFPTGIISYICGRSGYHRPIMKEKAKPDRKKSRAYYEGTNDSDQSTRRSKEEEATPAIKLEVPETVYIGPQEDSIELTTLPVGWKFQKSGRKQARQKRELYCVSWCDDSYVKHVDDQQEFRVFAACGHNTILMIEVEVGNSEGGMDIIMCYEDNDREESLYACVFGGRSTFQNDSGAVKPINISDVKIEPGIDVKIEPGIDVKIEPGIDVKIEPGMKRPRPEDNDVEDAIDLYCPQLLCAAGKQGNIKVIDPAQGKIIVQLRGHGDEIFDLRTSPINENLLLSASVDESIRLWNLQSFACISIFAGIHGHRKSV